MAIAHRGRLRLITAAMERRLGMFSFWTILIFHPGGYLRDFSAQLSKSTICDWSLRARTSASLGRSLKWPWLIQMATSALLPKIEYRRSSQALTERNRRPSGRSHYLCDQVTDAEVLITYQNGTAVTAVVFSVRDGAKIREAPLPLKETK
jgi:hypothetical protein